MCTFYTLNATRSFSIHTPPCQAHVTRNPKIGENCIEQLGFFNEYQTTMPPDTYDFLQLILVYFYCLLVPYTKVEESFNLQAIHDILNFGILDVPKYDHIEFSGVVPRTFIGGLALAGGSWPVVHLLQPLGFGEGQWWGGRFLGQLVARLLLGTITTVSLSFFRRAVYKQFGSDVARYMALLLTVQFHWVFWASRTLPNMLAFPIVIMAYTTYINNFTKSYVSSGHSQSFIPSPIRPFIFILTAVAIIFRFELTLLLISFLIIELIVLRRISFLDLFITGISSAFFSLLLVLPLDTYFWGPCLDTTIVPVCWPEAAGFYFNGIENRSSEWGISPWWTYFSRDLPRILQLSLPLSLYACITSREVRRLLAPQILYITMLSFLPHKEWRFIVYVIPIFTLAASIGFNTIMGRTRRSPRLNGLVRFSFVGGLLMSLAISVGLLGISWGNYPGGVALRKVHEIIDEEHFVREGGVKVHIDVFVAMTGASRFGEIKRNEGWSYFKNETLNTPESYTNFTHILTSSPEYHAKHFHTIYIVSGYDHVSIRRPHKWAEDLRSFAFGGRIEGQGLIVKKILPLEIVWKEKVWIMERRKRTMDDELFIL